MKPDEFSHAMHELDREEKRLRAARRRFREEVMVSSQKTLSTLAARVIKKPAWEGARTIHNIHGTSHWDRLECSGDGVCLEVIVAENDKGLFYADIKATIDNAGYHDNKLNYNIGLASSQIFSGCRDLADARARLIVLQS